jgi:hypothetical protein
VILLEDATRVVRRGQWRSSDQNAQPFSLINKMHIVLIISLFKVRLFEKKFCVFTVRVHGFVFELLPGSSTKGEHGKGAF